MKRKWHALALTLLMSAVPFYQPAALAAEQSGVSTSTSLILLYLNNREAFINQEKVTLDAPATVIDDRLFVPAKFLGDAVGFPVMFDAATNSVTMVTAANVFVIDLTAKTVAIGENEATGETDGGKADGGKAEAVEAESGTTDDQAPEETGVEGSVTDESTTDSPLADEGAGNGPPADESIPGGAEDSVADDPAADEGADGDTGTAEPATLPFEAHCAIVDNRLLVKLTWIADAMKLRYTYNAELRRVELIVIRQPAGAVNEMSGNSKPVAKFALGKEVYRIGEPVNYIDLSYDPDAEGLSKLQWTGKQDAFFEAGRYPVTLRVSDAGGNVSEPYTREVVVSEEVLFDRLRYDLHYKPEGSFIKLDQKEAKSRFAGLPRVEKSDFSSSGEKRALLVSDSPETFRHYGILYQDEANGRARLYANHVNGMSAAARFFILATNVSAEPATVTTTNKGEVFPSLYANVFGHNASTDFLLRDPLAETMTIPSGESYVYVMMPDLKPGQGINAIYDVEATGDVLFTFLATDAAAVPDSPLGYVRLPYEGHVRGTFPVSDVGWTLDLAEKQEPGRLIIGNGTDDPFVEGFDPMRGQAVVNKGNYGVTYTIRAERPPRMAILLLARGGIFKGPFKINGEMVLAPKSGVMTAFDGVQLLKRTTGRERELTIEFTPPAASAFPVDLIFWPLKDLER